MNELGWIAEGLTPQEVACALATLGEIVSEGHNADLSLRQQEVAEKVYQRWRSEVDETPGDDRVSYDYGDNMNDSDGFV